MKVNKEEMIKIFLNKIDVNEKELDNAREQLLKAYRIINIHELSDINKDLLNHNLKSFDFEINYHKKDGSRIVVNDGNIYFQSESNVNHNYFILNIYSFNEDDILNINTTKILVLKNVGEIGYVKFLNGEKIEGKRIYLNELEKELVSLKENLSNLLNHEKQLSKVLLKNI